MRKQGRPKGAVSSVTCAPGGAVPPARAPRADGRERGRAGAGLGR